jgi:surface antigen
VLDGAKRAKRYGPELFATFGVLVLAAGVAFASPAAAATARDYGYPYGNAPDCEERTGANCVNDQWGFTQGQCHSWVAYRLNALNRAQLRGGRFDSTYRQPAGRHWGGGGAWADDALRAGLRVDDVPALGAVAWWSANGGHVAYVEAVNPDGSVRISEMNRDFHNGFDVATLRRGGRWPDRFLHIADRAGAGAITSTDAGYWMVSARGTVYPFGAATNYGSATAAVAIASRRDGKGYWTVDAAGRVRAFGAATTYASAPTLVPGERVTTIAATPNGRGYWLFSNRGRVFARGDAAFLGDMHAVHLNGPVVASAATPTGRGYYMVGSDGGVFTFGDARFRGSTGAMRLNRPVVGIAPARDQRGYWLVASDGGVFSFGVPFRGSLGNVALQRPVNGVVPYGNGYVMVASDGGVFTFSNRRFLGSLAARPPASPIVGISAFTR